MKDVVEHTTLRLLLRDDVKVANSAMQEGGVLKAQLHFKYGADGASGQARYKLGFDKNSPTAQESGQRNQDDSSENEEEEEDDSNPSDANVFAATLVPLGLKVGDTWVILNQLRLPSCCLPIIM